MFLSWTKFMSECPMQRAYINGWDSGLKINPYTLPLQNGCGQSLKQKGGYNWWALVCPLDLMETWLLCSVTPLLTPAPAVFNQSVNESCYQGDDSVLKSLVEIADTAPKYLRPNLEATLQLCLKVSKKHITFQMHICGIIFFKNV